MKTKGVEKVNQYLKCCLPICIGKTSKPKLDFWMDVLSSKDIKFISVYKIIVFENTKPNTPVSLN